MALKERVQRAKAAAVFARRAGNDVAIPGREGRRYTVNLTSGGHDGDVGFVWAHCLQDNGATCKGNSNGHVCYHVFAAIIACARENKNDARFCATWDDAERLARLGGRIVEVVSGQGSGRVWTVVKRAK